MKAEGTLRRRLVTAYVLMTVIIGAIFGGAAYVVSAAAEYELIDVRLSHAADDFARNRRAGSAGVQTQDLRVMAEADLPAPLRALAAGVHEIEHQDRVLRVLIVRDERGRFAVIDDVSDYDKVEQLVFVSLWAAFFIGVLLALAIARATANRIIAPLTLLAETVQRGELSQQHALLSAPDEIGILARALEARNAELQDFLSRERFFTADVSHELRTPLTVILGAAEVLTSRLTAISDLHATAERIRRTAAETSGRVSALLQLARAPTQAAGDALELRALVRAEIERCRPLIQDKPVALSFEAEEEVWVHATPELPAIAVSNVLRNACRYTEKGCVRVVLTGRNLIVEDTGPGIRGAVRGRLFQPFARGEDGRSDGTGLGLSIAKRVTEHLDWTITFEEAPRGGSRFIFTFPRAKPPRRASVM